MTRCRLGSLWRWACSFSPFSPTSLFAILPPDRPSKRPNPHGCGRSTPKIARLRPKPLDDLFWAVVLEPRAFGRLDGLFTPLVGGGENFGTVSSVPRPLPFEVKRVQTIHCHGVEVARELALLFGIGTKALPAWNSKMRRNNLKSGLAIRL